MPKATKNGKLPATSKAVADKKSLKSQKKKADVVSDSEMASDAPVKDAAADEDLPTGFKIKSYTEGALLRSLDQGKLYEAKVIRVGEDNQYFIHYQGWNKKWDKWVHASLLMSEGPEAEKYSKALADQERRRKEARENAKRAASAGGGGAGGEGGAGKGGKSKKPRVDFHHERALEVVDPAAPQLKIPLPFTLKKQLVEDWEKVTQMDPQMLVPLPRTPCVADVVQTYLEVKAKRANAGSQEKLKELMEGLVIYFDAALPITLLYAKERHQYASLTAAHPFKLPSQLYGAEHLLRLFTKLPTILGDAPMAPVEASQLTTSLGDFLKHIQKSAASIFCAHYQVQTAQPPPPLEPSPPTSESSSSPPPLSSCAPVSSSSSSSTSSSSSSSSEAADARSN